MEWSTSRSCHFTPGKEPRYPLNRRLSGRHSRPRRFWSWENIFPLLVFEHRDVYPVAGPYTDYNIPAPCRQVVETIKILWRNFICGCSCDCPSVLGCYVVLTGKQLPTFRWSALPPSSESISLRRVLLYPEDVCSKHLRNVSNCLPADKV